VRSEEQHPEHPHPEESPKPAEGADAIVQIKVWLLGISPMLWRRLLVPASLTLRALHGVIQVAMGKPGSAVEEPATARRHFRASRLIPTGARLTQDAGWG
jgi:hypothetical protein